MQLTFHKYHGNGNDFILVDNRSGNIHLKEKQIRKICHRKFGIGSDGIIFLESHDKLDYHMNFYNPDASQSFCGNGSRCALHFARELGMIDESAKFLAIDGEHEASVEGEHMCIHMHDVNDVEKGGDYLYLNTGSPHYIVFVDDVDEIDVLKEGRSIRYNDRFKEKGTNVNFVEIRNGEIHSRVYERGVEDETYSSGTGSTAQAIASYIRNPELGNRITLHTKGGPIWVDFDVEGNAFQNIWLKGKVELVFSGNLDL